MGGFQSTAAALGGAGQDIATGAIANTEQKHKFLMDYLANQARSRQLDTEAAQQRSTATYQQGQLANDAAARKLQQQQFELSGYKDFGTTQVLKPDGSYDHTERVYRNLINGHEVRSPEEPLTGPIASTAHYNTLKGLKGSDGKPLFTDEQARGIAFSIPKSELATYQDYLSIAKQQFPSDPQKAMSRANELMEMHLKNTEALKGQWGFAPTAANTVDPESVSSYVAQLKDPSSDFTFSQIPGKADRDAVIKAFGGKIPYKLSAASRAPISIRRDAITNTLATVKRLESLDPKLLNSLPSSSLLALAQDPDSTIKALIARGWMSMSSDDEKTKIAAAAGDLRSLAEGINIIRSPLGATGFRSEESWAALQAQLGQRIASPGITKQTLTNTDKLLSDMLKTTNEALGTPSAAGSNGAGGAGTTRIIASDGSIHDIPTDKLDAAKQRDPGLRVQ